MIEIRGCESVVVGSLHGLMAEGLAGILKEGGCQTVQVASTAESVLETVDEAKPDIVIIDGCMCTDSMDLVHELSARGQPVALVVGPDWSGSFVLEAILAGAGGCISYDEQAAKFAASLGLIAQGLLVMSKTIGDIVAAAARDICAQADPERLSPREHQIALMVAKGATNKEIAESLVISEHTVKIHLGHILEKLNLRNRQQIAVYVAELGNGGATEVEKP